jgi:hypothetical protein
MKNAKHTPGPWEIERPFEEDGLYVSSESTALICEVMEHSGHGTPLQNEEAEEMDEANARLIAAAPDLLEALQYLHGIVLNGMTDDYDMMTAELGRAGRAIAKTTRSTRK